MSDYGKRSVKLQHSWLEQPLICVYALLTGYLFALIRLYPQLTIPCDPLAEL